MIIEDDIFVLKEVKYKDNDKILHALTAKNGKIQVIARGCRKNKSPLINVAQIMSQSKCELYVGKDMHTINNGEQINSFYGIRNNLTAYLHATYILELLNYVSQESEMESRIYNMTIKLFEILESIEEDAVKITSLIAAFELKLISMLGYRPELKSCVICGDEIKKNSSYFLNLQEGGVLCKKCGLSHNKGFDITIDQIIMLITILSSKLDNEIFKIEITDDIKSLIKRYLFFHIGKSNFTTLRMLDLYKF